MKLRFSKEERAILGRLLAPKFECTDCESCKGCPILKIGEVADIFNTTPDTIRYYEREGLISSYRDPENNYRLFDMRAVMTIFMARILNYLSMPLKNVKLIEEQRKDEPNVDNVKRCLLGVIDQSQSDLLRAQRSIKAANATLKALESPEAKEDLRIATIRALSDAGCLEEYLNTICLLGEKNGGRYWD